MIEVYLAKREAIWDLHATVFPHGGLGVAKEAKLASIEAESFGVAAKAITNLNSVTFAPNVSRWPVNSSKFRIINERNHSDREHFGNYRVEFDGKVIGYIKDFPRGNAVRIIQAALEMVAKANSVN